MGQSWWSMRSVAAKATLVVKAMTEKKIVSAMMVPGSTKVIG
jgi:hypothetical protein